MSDWLMTEWNVWQWCSLLAGPATIGLALLTKSRALRWTVLAVGLVETAPVLGLLLLNAAAGCYPWSPRIVPFTQGMTICPMQIAEGTLTMQATPRVVSRPAPKLFHKP